MHLTKDYNIKMLNVDCIEPDRSQEKSDLCSKHLINGNKFLDPMLQRNVTLCLQNQGRIVLENSIDRENFCVKLSKLNISCCNLPKVPEVIFKYKYLTDLNLSNNALEYLPNEIKNLPNLKSLNLSGNKLNSLPELLQHNHQLVYLNISHNNFIVIPDILYYGLRLIEILDISSNKITNFSEPPKCLNSLLELRLRDNKFKEVPNWIFNSPCKLQIMDLARNNLKCEPLINYYNSKIFQTLRVLNIENCNFRHKTIQFLHHFKNIEILNLGNKKEFEHKNSPTNYIGNLEIDTFKNFIKLKKLSLNYIGLALFPSGLYSFTNIEFLNLSDNLLSWLPESFCHLISLKILDLTSNQLLFLPNNIGDLKNLREIYLGRNQLNELPQSFNNLTNLEFIDLYNNKIEIIDQNIILQAKLRGIDLGMNCLDINNVEHSSYTIWKHYNELKVSYREHFGVVDNRSDVQTKVDHTDEIIYEYSDDNNSISDNDSVLSFEESSNAVVTHYIPNEELWEEWNVPEVEKDDLFDPNVKNYVSSPPNLYSAFQTNYCPAYSNVQSLRLNLRGSNVLDSVIEGQFDSD